MRELKFRVWNLKTKRWYVVGQNNIYKSQLIPTFEDEQVLMQYTGLKDKNGKEIYEGDIVKANHPDDEDDVRDELAVVVYNAPSFHAKYVRADLNKFIAGGYGFILRPQNEVIGNIHETPELLSQDGVTTAASTDE